jgi:hypothetical protein
VRTFSSIARGEVAGEHLGGGVAEAQVGRHHNAIPGHDASHRFGVVGGLSREAGGGADERLWLCSPDWRQAASWACTVEVSPAGASHPAPCLR